MGTEKHGMTCYIYHLSSNVLDGNVSVKEREVSAEWWKYSMLKHCVGFYDMSIVSYQMYPINESTWDRYYHRKYKSS